MAVLSSWYGGALEGVLGCLGAFETRKNPDGLVGAAGLREEGGGLHGPLHAGPKGHVACDLLGGVLGVGVVPGGIGVGVAFHF